MKILILLIITTWSFGLPYPGPVKQIVSCPEEAAMIIFDDHKYDALRTEPDRKKYTLYEIDLTTKSIKEVEIPVLSFSKISGSEE